jgi:predicted metal-dependent peptidase
MDMNDEIYVAVAKARVSLLFNNPFFGSMATRLQLILTDEKADAWCNTAATDGKRLWFSRRFVKKLTKSELLFVMGHEVLHCVFDHLGRRQGRDPKYWNMAGDYVINYTLVNNKIGTMPPVGLYDDKFTDEMTTEEIYEYLKQNSVEIKMPLDQHLDAKGGADGGEAGEGGGKTVTVTVTGDGSGPPVLTQDELDQIRQEVLADTIQAIQSAEAQKAGSVPAGIKRLVADLTEPKMDWRAMLDSHLRSTMKDDFTFQRLSRRQLSGGFILPAQSEIETVRVHCSIDTSGSMGPQLLQEILSEVKGIMNSFPDFELRVWSFDTKVYNEQKFTPANLNDIDSYELMGGGGTDFMCNWAYMKDNDIEPDRFVMFTDGYPCSEWGDPNYCPTLFIIHGGNKEPAPDWAMTAFYEDAAN